MNTNSKVCVTGGAGFIGKILIASLQKNGVITHVLSRKSGVDKPLCRFFIADLSHEKNNFDDFLDDVEVIYHCAGEISDTALMYRVHVNGTERLLEAIRQKLKITKKTMHWVQLSSVGAYGPPTGDAHDIRIVTETTSHAPRGQYEITKTLSDELVMKFAEQEPLFSYTILRPSNVIGPTMTNQSLSRLITMIKKGYFFYIGNRSAISTYIHVDDVVSALMLCASDVRARGEIFNLSNDCKLSDIVKNVADDTKIKPPTLCVPEKSLRFIIKLFSFLVRGPLTSERIDALVKRTNYPAKKIENMLGFVPRIEIPSAIVEMFKENRKK
ncbi:NAD-dependent epimerase/dehydratase family protein [Collimonas sp.]|uniref:NAD-dependent epimerase/dehydratase family protein n=1 Tax=Collimonas sp. TaxID=1963772 RepID=UPI002BC34B26|nr:NAD-dependent epimerase/dehydratase family protein [Collimonas sp.]HWX00135.1 NAD-dependent epimerase/dehydratase family protein [Collimonas sp.]